MPRMVVIAPHPDDEVLGAGGTAARFADSGGEVTVLTVAAHMPPLYPDGVHSRTIEEAHAAQSIIGVKSSLFLDYPAVLLRDVPTAELNRRIADAVLDVEPHILLVPFPDRHVDHRVVFEASMVISRPIGVGRTISLVAAYETLSETHWNAPHIEPNFVPNWCVDITVQIEKKLQAMHAYVSQSQAFPGARSVEALRALALFRGSQIGVGFAEAFQVLRMTSAPEQLARGGTGHVTD